MRGNRGVVKEVTSTRDRQAGLQHKCIIILEITFDGVLIHG